MQLSELLGLDVLDDTAARLGTVVDVRLTVDGDLDDNPAAPNVVRPGGQPADPLLLPGV